MGKASRRKRERLRDRIPSTPRASDDEVLVCYRIARGLSDERLMEVLMLLFKFTWLENARLLAKVDGDEHLVLVSFLDAAAAERVRENLKRNEVADVTECAVPEAREQVFKPWGYVFPKRVGDTVAYRVSLDPDMRETYAEGIADRMDREPEGDYIFPDLSPQEYEAIRSLQKGRPQ